MTLHNLRMQGRLWSWETIREISLTKMRKNYELFQEKEEPDLYFHTKISKTSYFCYKDTLIFFSKRELLRNLFYNLVAEKPKDGDRVCILLKLVLKFFIS